MRLPLEVFSVCEGVVMYIYIFEPSRMYMRATNKIGMKIHTLKKTALIYSSD